MVDYFNLMTLVLPALKRVSVVLFVFDINGGGGYYMVIKSKVVRIELLIMW